MSKTAPRTSRRRWFSPAIVRSATAGLRRLALASALAGACAGPATPAFAAPGEAPIPARLPIPSVASQPADFVPAGFALEREVTGDFGSGAPGVVQVYENAAGRRALLVGYRTPAGFEASGWGFVVACRTCGIDIPGDRNVEVSVADRAIQLVDRSLSRTDGTRTEAHLTLRYDAGMRAWRLARLDQFTVFEQEGRALRSTMDYLSGATYDAEGRYDGLRFLPDREQNGQAEPQPQTLETLDLY